MFKACFKEPTPANLGRVLFTRRAVKAPLRAQAAPAESQPQYQTFHNLPKTICLGQKKILRKMADNIFLLEVRKSSYEALIFKF